MGGYVTETLGALAVSNPGAAVRWYSVIAAKPSDRASAFRERRLVGVRRVSRELTDWGHHAQPRNARR
jgi:hypothetical protein